VPTPLGAVLSHRTSRIAQAPPPASLPRALHAAAVLLRRALPRPGPLIRRPSQQALDRLDRTRLAARRSGVQDKGGGVTRRLTCKLPLLLQGSYSLSEASIFTAAMRKPHMQAPY